MRFFGSLFLLLFFLISCQDIKHTPKPDDLIPEDKMVDVLVDISLLHGARSYNKTLLEQKGVQPYNYLWEKYRIDSTRFERSSNYYADNPRRYEKIYERVKIRLETLQVRYDSIREIEERRQDSIEQVKRDSLGVGKRPEFKSLSDSVIKRGPAGRRMPPPMSREDSLR